MTNPNYEFEIYQDKKDEYRWTATDSEGNKVGAVCEGYSAKPSCVSNAKRHGMGGEFVGGEKDTWEFYEDKAGKNRWRRTAVNKEIVGASFKGFATESEAIENAKSLGYKA